MDHTSAMIQLGSTLQYDGHCSMVAGAGQIHTSRYNCLTTCITPPRNVRIYNYVVWQSSNLENIRPL